MSPIADAFLLYFFATLALSDGNRRDACLLGLTAAALSIAIPYTERHKLGRCLPRNIGELARELLGALGTPDVEAQDALQFINALATCSGNTEVFCLLSPRTDPGASPAAGAAVVRKLVQFYGSGQESPCERMRTWQLSWRAEKPFYDALEAVSALKSEPWRGPRLEDEQFYIKASSFGGYTEIVRILLAHPRVDPTNMEFWEATHWGNVATVDLLLADGRPDPGAEYEHWGNIALAKAVEPDVVRALLRDPRVEPSRVLTHHIHRRDGKTLEILLQDPRVCPTSQDLTTAVEGGYDGSLKALLKDGRAFLDDTVLKDAVSSGEIMLMSPLFQDSRVEIGSSSYFEDLLLRALVGGDFRDLEMVPLLYAQRLLESEQHLLHFRVLNREDEEDYEEGRGMGNVLTSLLVHACKQAHVESVRFLLAEGRADPTVDDSNVLYDACRKGHLNIVKALLADGRADPTEDESIALREAAKAGQDHEVGQLLEDSRADPQACAGEALRKAAAAGHDRVVELLLKDSRADPGACDGEAIREAAGNGHVEVVKMLMSDGPGARKDEALRKAAFNGHDEVVDVLVKSRRCDVRAGLIAAVAGCHETIVVALTVRKFLVQPVSGYPIANPIHPYYRTTNLPHDSSYNSQKTSRSKLCFAKTSSETTPAHLPPVGLRPDAERLPLATSRM